MVREIDAWGASRRHYTKPAFRDALASGQGWDRALKQIAPQCYSTVDRTVKLWNQKIRNQLSAEIGFQLRGRHVPVQVVDGMPVPLSKVLGLDDGLAVLVLNQSLLRSVVEGTRFMSSVWENVSDSHGSAVGPARRSEVVRTGETAQAWLELAKRHDLVQELRRIDEDVLGAYFFHKPEVKIYWLAIGIFAALLGVSIEALTFVVLAHELAHAYTHLGSDIDGYVWPTRRFASTDVAIIEGLAQFYAEVVCGNLNAQVPEAVPAFEALLERQNEIYATHRNWVRKDDRNSGEIVRVSLLECRRSGRTMHREDFAETVRKRRHEITVKQ